MGRFLPAVGLLIASASLGACGSSDVAGSGGVPPAAGGSAGSAAGGSGGELSNPAPVEFPEHEGISQSAGDPRSEPLGTGLAECEAQNPGLYSHVVELAPADTNGRGSALLAREALLEGRAPVPIHLRTHEMLNHYAPRLELGGPLLSLYMRDNPGVPGTYELAVGVETAALAPGARPPVVLTLAIDVTSSMLPALPRVHAAVSALASSLRAGDVVRWMTTNDPPSAVSELGVVQPDDPALLALAAALSADADDQPSSLSALVTGAVEAARSKVVVGAWNRIVVITDGGDVVDEPAYQALQQAASEDVLALAVGVGKAFEPPPRALRLIGSGGRGPYIHVDDGGASVLAERFDELFGRAYDDLRIRLTVPWYFEIQRPYVFATTSADGVDPQYIAPGQALVFPFRLSTCSPLALQFKDEIVLDVFWTQVESGAELQATVGRQLKEMLQPLDPSEQWPAEHAFAVVAYAEALRALDATRLTNALSRVEAAHALKPDPGLAEIAALIPKHPLLAPAP